MQELRWYDVVDLGTARSPRGAIAQLVAARSQGAPVHSLLLERASLIQFESVRGSLPSVASALRAWHCFATGVLGYPENATLPPRNEDDLIMFISVFRVAKTAANYVGSVHWSCVHLGLDTTWRGDRMQQCLRGARKRTTRLVGAELRTRVLLNDVWVHQLVRLADNLALDGGFQLAVLIGYEFLLRVKSEGIPLQCGDPREEKVLMPGRHSAVWAQNDRLYVRLQRRKNRSHGSLLTRRCRCSTLASDVCVYHRALFFLQRFTVGDCLFDFNHQKFLKDVRRFSVILGMPHASDITFKSFRAGKATQLAAQGVSLGDIVNAGEWKSNAFLRYVDEDLIGPNGLLDHLAESIDEE